MTLEPTECQLCIKERVATDQEPLMLEELPIKTLRLEIPVLVCPYCDGGIKGMEYEPV